MSFLQEIADKGVLNPNINSVTSTPIKNGGKFDLFMVLDKEN